MSDREYILRLHEELGVDYAMTGRVLGISRQRARILRLELDANGNGHHPDPADPKGVLTRRLRNKLRSLGISPEQAIERKVWENTRGIGDASRKLLLRHYG